MLPRSLFLIVAASCWLQINAVPVQSQEDYQSLQDDDKDLMDYAFTDTDGAESFDVDEDISETSDKTSILEVIKDTMETMDKMGALKDKQNINVNANSPKYKKKMKKAKLASHKRPQPKVDDTNASRKSTQQFQETSGDSFVVTEREHDIAGVKSRNHCNDVRRSLLNNHSQNINVNSSYLDTDEDFTIKSKAKMRKTRAVFNDDYITLCWIETTTTKEDNSIKPPKRLILREFTISFENAAAIPDEYLSCPEIVGDITLESPEAVCNTVLNENVENDTQFSRIVNLTRKFRENNLDIYINKVIKCAMGSVITKDIYQWLNPTESTRQRVEIKVSPNSYATNAFCSKYQQKPTFNTTVLKNESAECSDESKEEEIEDNDQSERSATECSGKSCSDVESIASTILPSNVSEIHGSLFTKYQSLIGKLTDIVTQPSVVSSMSNYSETKKPLHIPVSDSTVSQTSVIAEINDLLYTKEPLDVLEPEIILSQQPSIPERDDSSYTKEQLDVVETEGISLPPLDMEKDDYSQTKKPLHLPKQNSIYLQQSEIPEISDHAKTKKPLYLGKPGDTLSPVNTWFSNSLTTANSLDTTKLMDSLLSGDMENSSSTRRPKFLENTPPEFHLPYQPMEFSCVGPDCLKTDLVKTSTTDLAISEGKPNNITRTSDEQFCEGSNCKDTELSSESEVDQVAHSHHHKENVTSSSEELIKKEKEELYIPKPFVCPVNNKIICEHLERISKLQEMKKSSEENVEQVTNKLKKLTESNETSSDEEREVELGDFVPISTTISSAKLTPSYIVSTLSSEQLSSLEHMQLPYDKPGIQLAHDISSHESQSLSSLEIISDEMKTTFSSEENASWSVPAKEFPAISINQTQQAFDILSSDDTLSLSEEMEKNYGSSEAKLNESCDKMENCYGSNTSYTNKISPSLPSLSIEADGQVTPLVKDNKSKSSLDSGIGEEDDEDESCDCDEESEENKKCDPKTGLCESQISHLSEDKFIASLTLNDGQAPSEQPEIMTTGSEVQILTSPIITEKDREKGTGTETTKNLSKNHKLSLKIHVTLEHIDENRENLELAQVEKDVLLNELPEQHGNHSLYWHIQALNKSANDVESLKDLFNCTILEQLTEAAIINQLNITDLNDKITYFNDNTNGIRHRRSVDNINATLESKNNSELLINSSLIKELILPHIREDIKAGLADMLDHIIAMLNNSKSNASEKSDNIQTSSVRTSDSTIAGSESTTVTNRIKRSLIIQSDTNDAEELSRWSNERFTPSTDGGRLRSFTELKILKNFVGVK